MQRLEVSGAVRPLYESLGVKGLMGAQWFHSDGQTDRQTGGMSGTQI